jgi:hypothetical protein
MFRQSGFVAALLLLQLTAALAQQIPTGTVLPVMANSSLDSTRSKPGDKFTGRLMQDVALSSGEKIRAGAKIEGQVVESSSPGGANGARLVVRFDRLIFGDKQTPVMVSLRSLASMNEVFNAQLPVNTFDEYGTSSSDWNTIQVGGAAVYRGDGTVRSAMDIVGRATDYGAVTAKLLPAPKLGCPASSTDGEQSLWVFSPWACGAYGFDDLTIAHHGNNPPVGTIELTSPKSVHVRGGSGWLLRVVASDPGTSHSPWN